VRRLLTLTDAMGHSNSCTPRRGLRALAACQWAEAPIRHAIDETVTFRSWNRRSVPEQRPHSSRLLFGILTPSALAMLRARALLAALLPLVLAAGAAGQDRNGDTDTRRLLARASRLLLQEEMRGNCAGLTVTTKVHIDRLRELEKTAKKEREGPAVTMFGERPAVENAAKERERVEALNVVLDAKGCTPVNIEEELQKAPPPAIEGKDASVKKAKLR
jgi:hypothetical protein